MRYYACLVLIGIGWGMSRVTPEPLTLVKTIPLPNVNGRIDHLAIDPANNHVYIAALGNNTVEVVDGQAGVHVRSLPGFHEPQGIALAADANLVAVANGAGGDLSLLDRTDLHGQAAVPLGDDPDNVRYDAPAKRFFVGYGAGAIASVDPVQGRRINEVPLAGHPESFQLERSGSRIFVNVPDAHQIAVLDRASMTLLTTWPVLDAASNFPMALDEPDHRLFIGCRQPAMVLVYDTVSGKRLAAVPAVGDTDDLFYDAVRKRLYVSGGEGYLDVFEQPDAGHLQLLSRIPTPAGARTSLYVAEQSRLFLAVPHRGVQNAEIRVYDVQK